MKNLGPRVWGVLAGGHLPHPKLRSGHEGGQALGRRLPGVDRLLIQSMFSEDFCMPTPGLRFLGEARRLQAKVALFVVDSTAYFSGTHGTKSHGQTTLGLGGTKSFLEDSFPHETDSGFFRS